jgi:hypothetical protein
MSVHPGTSYPLEEKSWGKGNQNRGLRDLKPLSPPPFPPPSKAGKGGFPDENQLEKF